MPLILIGSDRFAEHQTPPGHPERPERAEVMDVIAGRWREHGGEVVAPRAATRDQLARVHDADYLRRISETAGRAVALDPDTYTSPESHDIALLAAGAAVDAVERVMGTAHHAAVAMVRPPGHHAERDRAMGFCLYNNVAVAAAHARAQGAAKVAIVDYDVHERDPLGGMRVSTAGFGAMTRELRRVAADVCRGRIVSVTEGGYDLQALAASLDAVIDAHAEATSPSHITWPSSGMTSDRA